MSTVFDRGGWDGGIVFVFFSLVRGVSGFCVGSRDGCGFSGRVVVGVFVSG